MDTRSRGRVACLLVAVVTAGVAGVCVGGCSRAGEGESVAGRSRTQSAGERHEGDGASAPAAVAPDVTAARADERGGPDGRMTGSAMESTDQTMKAATASTTDSQAGSQPATAVPANVETAIFGMGCFWSPEEMFRQVPGVLNTAVGYTGGRTPNPTYREVCSDSTGHAEVVLVQFDPSKIGYAEVLELFWKKHNPTQLNYQGPDVGEQYRSVIFFTTAEQERVARESKARLEASKKWPRPIVTQIEQAGTFYRAEEYHQRYYQKRGGGSCPTGLPD